MYTSSFHGLPETPEDRGCRRNDSSGVSVVLTGPIYPPLVHHFFISLTKAGWKNLTQASKQVKAMTFFNGSIPRSAYPRLVAMMMGMACTCWLEPSYQFCDKTHSYFLLWEILEGQEKGRQEGKRDSWQNLAKALWGFTTCPSQATANSPIKMNFEIWSNTFEKKSYSVILGILFYFILLLFLATPCGLQESHYPTRDRPRPRQWKPGILTTRSPGNSLYLEF